jgi:hypothetical protein
MFSWSEYVKDGDVFSATEIKILQFVCETRSYFTANPVLSYMIVGLILFCTVAVVIAWKYFVSDETKEKKKMLYWVVFISFWSIAGMAYKIYTKPEKVEAMCSTYETLKRIEINIEKSNRNIEKQVDEFINRHKISYPIKEELILLRGANGSRKYHLEIGGLDSKEYKVALEAYNKAYETALKKIPNNDPLKLVLWINPEYSFLKEYNFILNKEQKRQSKDTINKLLLLENDPLWLGYMFTLLDLLKDASEEKAELEEINNILNRCVDALLSFFIPIENNRDSTSEDFVFCFKALLLSAETKDKFLSKLTNSNYAVPNPKRVEEELRQVLYLTKKYYSYKQYFLDKNLVKEKKIKLYEELQKKYVR